MTGRTFLGRYETRRLLGEGGMGRVYLARQTDTGREVVVKVMHDHIATDPKFRDRFERETVLMARFRHPGAVTLYDASLSDPNGPCIVMEYIKGVNLETLLARSGRMGPARVGRVVGELCEVLQAAHDEGIIHRDLKPANLMIVDPDTPRERVKVMDFGLAKLVGADAGRKKVTDTNVDFAVGTPGYICPEQVRGEEMDPRGDLYSVGVMMYELLTGRVPFEGPSSMDVLLAHATEPPPAFAEVGAGGRVPAEVERLVMDCLAKDPAGRPQTARELAERFDTALARAEQRAERRAEPRVPFAEEIADDVPRGLSKVTTAILANPVRETKADAARDADALPFFLAAWMPEAVALIKLRGFVHAAGGEVVESVPGRVKVRLGGRGSSASSAFSWFGLRKATGPLDVELHLRPADPAHPGRLAVHVLFRPGQPSLLGDEAWRDKCTQVFVELRSYLMGREG